MSSDTFSDSDYWLTIPEAARRMRLSEKSVRNYIKRGYLEAHRVGPRTVVISIDAISNAYRPYGTSYARQF